LYPCSCLCATFYKELNKHCWLIMIISNFAYWPKNITWDFDVLSWKDTYSVMCLYSERDIYGNEILHMLTCSYQSRIFWQWQVGFRMYVSLKYSCEWNYTQYLETFVCELISYLFFGMFISHCVEEGGNGGGGGGGVPVMRNNIQWSWNMKNNRRKFWRTSIK
jgi:hypothetical protein